MLKDESNRPVKRVHFIQQKIEPQAEIKKQYRQLRIAAYCRVSTKQEEQLNSYETQKNYYTEQINKNSDWKLVKIFADKGITGTSVKKRDEFNKMIRLCKQGKIDMIICKSISRFARNTVDCLHYTRMLKEIGVDVYFEEQQIHSTQPGAEFYITIYGSIAQSESENMSANIKWGKAQSAKEGKVAFHYRRFLGYKEGADGNPEIDEDEAKIIRLIYERFLAGDSLLKIATYLDEHNILTPAGKNKWAMSTIKSILSNERYMGDAIINKTYISDYLTKKVKINNGERPKYYVENNHPAIIDKKMFIRVQEELARRSGKPKVKQIGTKTEKGKYSSKYALTELLVCGECKTPYRRCTWTARGKRKIVWRCINRLDFGKKYCHNSPTIEESVLQEAIMEAIANVAKQNVGILETLKGHIGLGLENDSDKEQKLNKEIRIAEIEAEINNMISSVSADTIELFDEERAEELMKEKSELQQQLALLDDMNGEQKKQSRLKDISNILTGIKNRPMIYDDKIVRELIECVVVESKEKIKVIFVGGLEIEQPIEYTGKIQRVDEGIKLI